MGRRDALGVTADILEIADGGAKKTHLVYKSNTNFRMIQRYLDVLTSEEAGPLLEERDGLWHTTKAGRLFVTRYQKLRASLPAFDE